MAIAPYFVIEASLALTQKVSVQVRAGLPLEKKNIKKRNRDGPGNRALSFFWNKYLDKYWTIDSWVMSN